MKLPALSLRYRIALVIVLLVAAMMAVLLWQMHVVTNRATHSLHASNEKVLLEVLDQIAGTALLTEDYSEVQRYVDKVGMQPTLDRILVADIRGRIVISNDIRDVGKSLSDIQPSESHFWHTSEVASPAGRLGTLAIAFNTSLQDALLQESLRMGIAIAIGGMVVIAMVGIAVGYALTRRLDAVVRAASGFARGDRGIRSAVDGRDEIGELGRTFDAMIDQVVTQQSRLEALVAKRTAKLREQADIIDQVNDAVLVVDLEGKITGWNRGGERQFGYSSEEVLGRHLHMLYPPSDRGKLRETIIGPVMQHGGLEIELPMLHRDGSTFYSHLSLSLLRDDREQPKGIIVLSTDITQRRNKDAQLKTALDQVSAANLELEAFSYSVSHDLRAPLRAVDGFSQALLEDYGEAFDSVGKDYLTRVRSGAQNMAQLIDDLLQLSRVTRREIKREKVDVSALSASVVDGLQALDPGREVAVEITPELSVEGDLGLVRIVLENLIGNAWKYTSKQQRASISVDRADTERGPAITVRDNGAGFDMQHVDKLFGAFQRLHHEEEFPGTGIGLATVRRIMTRHGGEVWADGTPGGGACFYFAFPAGASGE